MMLARFAGERSAHANLDVAWAGVMVATDESMPETNKIEAQEIRCMTRSQDIA